MYDPFAPLSIFLSREFIQNMQKFRYSYVPNTFNKLLDNLFCIDSNGKLKRALKEYCSFSSAVAPFPCIPFKLLCSLSAYFVKLYQFLCH